MRLVRDFASFAFVVMVTVVLAVPTMAQNATSDDGKKPTVTARKRVSDVDPPQYYRDRGAGQQSVLAKAKSVIKDKPAGIAVGDYAPDFQLEPIDIHADIARWLGDKTPEKFEDKVMLSDFVGTAPVILLFGSYT